MSNYPTFTMPAKLDFTQLDEADLICILSVWRGKFDHRDQSQLDQSVVTMTKLEAIEFQAMQNALDAGVTLKFQKG